MMRGARGGGEGEGERSEVRGRNGGEENVAERRREMEAGGPKRIQLRRSRN